VSTLFLVGTPIGNMGDLTPRAVEVLRAVGLVCCEDTRRTGLMLNNLGVDATLMRLDEHTEVASIPRVLDALNDGRDVALVSDAGTPAVSDPGAKLVAAVVESRHVVTAVPGASAALAALTISGLPTDRFVFEGFLPRSGVERTSRLAAVARESRTVVLFEAPHRLERTLDDLLESCGDDRPVAVCRELTKMHEETLRGSLSDVRARIGEPRGEYVIVLGGATESGDTSPDEIDRMLRHELASGASTRDAAATVAEMTGTSRKALYARALDLGRG
jgi:16S rRNA (cytidine1402-2'-O)-methyltransferase